MLYENVYLIGLTGNIACGKSTVVAMLHDLGAHVIDADRVTHALQQPGEAVYAQIVATFGAGILSVPSGPIDRRALGAIVFSDAAALRQLEQIVHPAVRARIRGWLEAVAMENARQPAPAPPAVAVIDAIKLLEAGWKPLCDAIWVVSCPPEQQLARLITTRGMSEDEARTRIAAQPPQAEKISQASVVIDNSGTIEQTRAQVAAAWQAIT